MVAVQWYPGHMEKARRQMQDQLRAVDMIIELRDARIPKSSANPILDQMAPGKPRLILLGKSDLADEEATKEWIASLKQADIDAMAADLMNDRNAGRSIASACLSLTAQKRQQMIRKGIRPRAMRAMICGIPNSGKSTLINRIAGKKRAKAEDRPGVTRALTWIHADPALDILDTPGVLWPKFEDPRTGSLLAAAGAVNEDILDLKDIAMDTMHVIRELYPGVLEQAYEAPADMRIDDMLEQIAMVRHLTTANGVPDIDRAAGLFLREFRRGKLGRLTLERPDETNK